MVTLSKSLILVHYEINKDEITAKYCVNKDKPTMHCCGKCLLKKKLAEQEEQQKFPAFPDIKTDIPIVQQAYHIYKIQNIPFIQLDNSSKLISLFESKGLFHPPSLV